MTEAGEHSEYPAELARFVSELSYDDVPEAGVENVELCFLDTVGVALAATTEATGRIVGDLAAASSAGSGPATLWGHDGQASMLDATFANGTASHALDFDDVTPAKTGHPSAPMVAPILATAELAGARSGQDLVSSYVAGFEAQALLGEVLNPGHYQQGWHSTATLGTFGSAMAVASLLDLSPTETRHALNVAASVSSGLIRNFGSMTKPLHAGQAARGGATAALLAADGFTGAADAITGERGYVDLHFGSDAEYRSPPASPENFAIVRNGVFFKKYPSCNRTSTSIAATTHLVKEYDIDPGDVKAITATISERASDVLHHDDPETPLEGKFSIPYTIANAVVHRHVGIETFTEEVLHDPAVQAIRELVKYEVDESLPYSSYESHIEITTSDGPVSQTVVDPPGQYNNPMSRSELRAKFVDCASRVVADYAVDDLVDLLLDLRNAEAADVDRLIRSL